jgi:hypothetical protein
MINSAHHGISVGSLGDGAAVVFMDRMAGLAGPGIDDKIRAI